MSTAKKFLILIGDIVLLYGSLILTLIIRYGADELTMRLDAHLEPFSVIFIGWLLVFYLFNLYRYNVARPEQVIRSVFGAVLVSSIVSAGAFYFFPGFFELTPKTNLVIFGVLMFALKYGWQYAVLRWIFPSGAEKIVILGKSDRIAETIAYLETHPHIGYQVAAWIKDPQEMTKSDMMEAVHGNKAHTIIIHPDLAQELRVSKLAYALIAHNVNVINFWDFFESVFERVPLSELDEPWFIQHITAHRPMYEKAKRVIDGIFSVCMLILFSPFMLLFAILIPLTSKGPIIFTQERVGKDGKLFTLYKFRTMKDGHNGPLWTEKSDTRLTTIGKVLRSSHLDELPQFFNILKGDISLIGPRPERIELVEKYRSFPHYDMRHIIKPGLTGWAQVNYRPSASLEEAEEKLCYDIYYIKNRSLFLDLLIVLKTIRMLFTSNQ